jgi:hypothetical protein
MERAGRVFRKLKTGARSSTSSPLLADEQLAQAAWPLAVGKKIGARSQAVGLVRDRLIVEVEDAVWQRQLFTLRGQILARLEQVLGSPVVTQLEFKIAVPKRGPQREERSSVPADEADSISDPVLRTLYIAARRKATA